MKEYGQLFKDEAEYWHVATEFSSKVKDIMEFLAENGWKKPKKVGNLRITYHDPCHLVHTQKIEKQPREIIKSIEGVEYIELPEASWCCGSAGIYNVIRYDDALKVLERKMNNIKATGADWVVTGNPGCMIQLLYGVKKFNLNIRIIHPVSLLNMAYRERGEVN
jgi:glycolate oxidase iron-sulfur subunit